MPHFLKRSHLSVSLSSTPSGARNPAISKLWLKPRDEFVPFPDYDVEIRKVICSTNVIESLNAKYRRAIRT